VKGYNISIDQEWYAFSTGNDTVIRNLLPATTYTVSVTAVDLSGNESPPVTTEVTTPSYSAIGDTRNNVPSVFPNPVSDKIRITGMEGVMMITACNLSGQEIITLRTDGLEEMTIDTGSWETGTYILNFRMYDGESISCCIQVIHK
jgi:hypothetical protein